MKNRIRIIILVFVSVFCFSGCVNNKTKIVEPDIEQVKNISNLATLECYYHNVAKSVKPAGKGLTHIGENDRKFWIEYNGIARLGIDISEVDMKVNGTNIEISLPEVKVMNISIDESSLNEDSYVLSRDGFNRNKISAEDQSAAIKQAQDKMKETIINNSSLLLNAQNRAKKLIGNYIEQLGKAQGIEYSINWKLDSINSSENYKIEENSTSD